MRNETKEAINILAAKQPWVAPELTSINAMETEGKDRGLTETFPLSYAPS